MKAIHSVVCIKPVPDPNQFDRLRLDPETMLLERDKVPAVINPLDRVAIEQALLFRERFGGKVTVITMAAPEAEEQLREALAMGCDRACLLTDKAFAGGDTWATAKVLAAAIKKLGRFDMVFCGGCSADGSTAQVGPQLAELLGVADLVHVFQLETRKGGFRAHCRLEGGHAVYDCGLPVLVTMDKEANVPRAADMVGIRKALNRPLTVWTAKDLRLKPKEVGLSGSPTQMLNIYAPSLGRKGEIIQGTPNEAVAELLSRLSKEKVL